jgi:hypothetical protein
MTTSGAVGLSNRCRAVSQQIKRGRGAILVPIFSNLHVVAGRPPGLHVLGLEIGFRGFRPSRLELVFADAVDDDGVFRVAVVWLDG